MIASGETIDRPTTPRTTFAADLTNAVYLVALRHWTGENRVNLHLGLWKAVNDVIDNWTPECSTAQRREQPDPW